MDLTNLNHGEVLYMPEGYWHYMKYITPGFLNEFARHSQKSKKLKLKPYTMYFIMRNYDNLMRRIKGQKWIDWKNEKAITNTHKSF